MSTNPNNANICEACAAALNVAPLAVGENAPANVQINIGLPAHIQADDDWLKSAPPVPERKQAVQNFLNSKSAPNSATNNLRPSVHPTPVSDTARSPRALADKVEVCGGCGRSYPSSQIYQVVQRQSPLRRIPPIATCTTCLAKLRQEWQNDQTYSSQSLVLAMLVGLIVCISLSLVWAWAAANTYQVAVFAIILVGLTTSKIIKSILGGRKGPLPGLITGVVMGVGLVLAFYFLYSQLAGSMAINWNGLTKSLQKNGLPFQTVLYFVATWLIAVLLSLALEPIVRDNQGQRVGFYQQ